MKNLTYEQKIHLFYETAYDYLRTTPGFDGRPHPDHPGVMRRGVKPNEIKPWPGAADAHRLNKQEWIKARLEAVALGEAEPPLRRR